MILCFMYVTSQAQKNNLSKLTIPEIMQGDGFVGHLPSHVNWSNNSDKIYFDWNPEAALSDSLYLYHLKNDKFSKVDFETEYALASFDFIFNTDKTKKVYTKHGDVFLVDVSSNKTLQVTQTMDYESQAHFTDNDNKIAYVNETKGNT